MRDKARDEAISAITELGKPETDPKPRIDALHFFLFNHQTWIHLELLKDWSIWLMQQMNE